MEINLKKVLEKVAQYRGVIITDSINTERLIEAIIINYFVKENKHSEFLMKCITDEYFSLGLKINTLERLNFSTYKQFFNDIRRINKIRNIFAHCSLGSLDGALLFYDPNKRIHETRKLEELHSEFLKKVKLVQDQLMKIFDNIVKENNEETSKIQRN